MPMRFIYHYKYYVIFFYVFLIRFYKFVLFLKSITKLVKHCNKNDEIKARVDELETAFSRENLTKKLLYGSYKGFPGQTHMGMPISALNGTGVDILMRVYPEWSQMGHT